MKMKFTVLSSLILSGLLLSTSVLAKPPSRGDREQRSVEDKVTRMTEQLGLDETQVQQLTEILTAAETEREALKEKHEAQVNADVCALKAVVTQQLDEVLTADQAAELDELMARKAAHRAEHAEMDGKGRGRHSRPDCEDTGV